MLSISRSSPRFSVLVPIARLMLRPLLWIRNFHGYWQGRNVADPQVASRQLGMVDARWRRKIDTVLSSPDNAAIPRVANAGRLQDGLITMHNGIQVSALGYYGGGILNMLVENKGVHEPQEERAFAAILKLLPPESTMIELGAYWGFYSLWFSREVPSARCYLVEPSFACLSSGEGNFQRAKQAASFTQAYVGDKDGVALDGTDIICVDDYCRKHQLTELNILHVDIQGAEVLMLKGASRMLQAGKVDYLFISTHSNELHANCLQILESHQYHILASADLDDSYSGDGLIVARSFHVNVPEFLEISHRSKHQASLQPNHEKAA